MGCRFALGCLPSSPSSSGGASARRPPTGRQLPYWGSLAAGLFLFAAAALQQIGLQYTSSAHSGFITGFYILFVPVLGMVFGHKVPESLWAAIPVCLVGFYLLSVTGDFVVSKGDWLTLVCAVLWACQILVIDHVVGQGDPVRIAFLQFAVCAVLSALCGLLFEHCTWSQVKAASGAIAYAGFMSVGVAYTLQVVCQKHCPPAPAAIIMSLEAVFAAIAGYLVLDQTLTGRAIAGCGLILCGVLIVQLLPMMRKNEGPSTMPPVAIVPATWNAISDWRGWSCRYRRPNNDQTLRMNEMTRRRSSTVACWAIIAVMLITADCAARRRWAGPQSPPFARRE